MRKHGLKSAAKRERLLAAAQDEADEAMAEQVWDFKLWQPHTASACMHLHKQQHFLKHEPPCISGIW